MILLFLSVVILVAGPAFYSRLRSGGVVARTFDHGFALVLAALVVLVLMPETIGEIGFYAVPVMLFGYLAPILLERGVHTAARITHVATLAIAAVGLGLHSVLDGAGLAAAEQNSATILPVVIIMHRLTVGMVLWFILEPAFGRNKSFVVLLFVAVATIAGYLVVQKTGQVHMGEVTHYLQAVILGTVIHGLIHRDHLANHNNHD